MNLSERFVPASMTDYRLRAWTRFVITLSFASSPCWLVFAVIGVVLSLPGWWVMPFPILGSIQIAIPFVIRRTGNLYGAMMVLGATAYVGITLSAILLGGFTFPALLWTIVLR